MTREIESWDELELVQQQQQLLLAQSMWLLQLPYVFLVSLSVCTICILPSLEVHQKQQQGNGIFRGFLSSLVVCS